MLAISRSTTNRLVADPGADGRVVKTVTVDSLAQLADQPVTLIKCDIEGAEATVFARSWDALAHVRKVLMELHTADGARTVQATLAGDGLELQPGPNREQHEVIAFVRS